MSATEDGSTQAVSATAGTASSTTRRREAHARAHRRAAEARAKRRAARRAAKARAARRAREARQREAAAAAAATHQHATEGSGARCDPNYEGACLDPDASDYDCEGGSGDGPEYTGTVRVVGDDPYDLDRDGDGTGCDP